MYLWKACVKAGVFVLSDGVFGYNQGLAGIFYPHFPINGVAVSSLIYSAV